MVDSEDMRVPAVVTCSSRLPSSHGATQGVWSMQSVAVHCAWYGTRLPAGKPRLCCGRSLRFPGKL